MKVRYKIFSVTDTYDERNAFGITLNVEARQVQSQDITESESFTQVLAGSTIKFTIHTAGMVKHPWIKRNEFDVDFTPAFN